MTLALIIAAVWIFTELVRPYRQDRGELLYPDQSSLD